ncbi:MAG TPA: hypothetical protein PK668_07815 [Myxococcota bacterium]|nr:hypothetical protein [Myxococcota bacterium]HRY93120.1 hypothetical protein [Myxococcota bacterium]
MTRAALAWALLLAALPAACGRDFSPPPPAVALDGTEPARGFAGDVVLLCGRNLEAEAALNLVYFDTELAEVLSALPAELPAGCEQGVWVVVPELGEPGLVGLRVSTSSSQASADNGFVYLGAGHPLDERVGNAFRVRTASTCMSLPVGPQPIGLALVAGVESASLDLVFLASGTHLSYGACLAPLSSAMLIELSAQPGLAAELSLYSVQFLGGDAGSLAGLTRLVLSTAALTDDGQAGITGAGLEVTLPEPPADSFFVPGLVYGACLDPGCQQPPGLVVTNLAGPGLAFLPRGQGAAFSVGLSVPGEQIPECPGLSPGGPVDVIAPAARPGHALASVGGTSELWDVELATGAAVRASPDGDARCLEPLGALASRRLSAVDGAERVYAAGQESGGLWEFAGGGDGALALPPTPVEGLVYWASGAIWDLETALFVDADLGLHERLVVAEEDGLHFLDLTAPDARPLRLEQFVPWPAGYNTSQSLAVQRHVDPLAPVAGARDEVVYADPTSDELLVLYAGAEQETLSTIGLGPTLPVLAFARRTAQIFMSDITANMIRPVDPRAGSQGDQIFPGEDAQLAVLDLATLELGTRELLLAGLRAEDQTGANGRELLGRLAVATLTDEGQPPSPLGCRLAGVGLPVLDLHRPGLYDLRYHQLFLLPGEAPEAVFLRYGQPAGEQAGTPGWLRVLSVEADDEGPDAPPLRLGEAIGLEVGLPPEVRLVTVSPRHGVLAALLGVAGQQGGPPGALVAVLDRAELAGTSLVELLDGARQAVLPPEAAMFVADLAVARVGRPEARRYLVALALSQLGEVMVVEPLELGAAGEPRVVRVPTGGLPVWLAVSPDERRLYVTHSNLGLVQAVDLCPDPPGCAADPAVSATLEVDPWPFRVYFSPSGDQAFVAHLRQGGITVIE